MLAMSCCHGDLYIGRNPYTGEQYLMAAIPKGIMLLQWFQPRHFFIMVKVSIIWNNIMSTIIDLHLCVCVCERLYVCMSVICKVLSITTLVAIGNCYVHTYRCLRPSCRILYQHLKHWYKKVMNILQCVLV